MKSHSTLTKITAVALMSAFVPAVTLTPVFTPASAVAQTTAPFTTSIMQVFAGIGTFSGTLSVTSFRVVNGALTALGTLSGTLTGTAGNVIGTVTNLPVSLPITSTAGSCTILTLHTGAIQLNLLGLNVTLSPIDLVITAQSGPGNLLGNLLCAVAHLLDSNASLTALANLLNNILRALP